jgi:RNA polymerase sigma-70 factor (ECF subfamily)
MNDDELIQEIAAKDHTAFKVLVDRYQALVVNTCYNLLGNRQDAEDVAQEVFVKVYQEARGFRAESKISTWLYRIAVNLSLNHRRKQKWDRYLDIFAFSKDRRENPAEVLEAPEEDRPDRQLEKKERSRILREALETLPGRQRVAMILHKFEGLSYQEIAEVLQTSLSAVESLIHRGKVNLQKKLLPLIEEI